MPIHLRRAPTNILLHHDLLHSEHILLVAVFCPEAARARDIIRQLNLIISSQRDLRLIQSRLSLHASPAFLALAVVHAIPATGRLDVSGSIGVLSGRGTEAGAGTLADDGPPSAQEGSEGGQTGADNADEGFDAGPDEDVGHCPGYVGGFDEDVKVDDADYACDADTGTER